MEYVNDLSHGHEFTLHPWSKNMTSMLNPLSDLQSAALAVLHRLDTPARKTAYPMSVLRDSLNVALTNELNASNKEVVKALTIEDLKALNDAAPEWLRAPYPVAQSQGGLALVNLALKKYAVLPTLVGNLTEDEIDELWIAAGKTKYSYEERHRVFARALFGAAYDKSQA